VMFTIVTLTKDDIDGFLQTYISISRQSSQVFEWVVKDGSVNQKLRLDIRHICNKSGAIYVEEPDSGIYNAMNIAARYARNDWLIFLNGGDIFASDSTLQQLFDFIVSNNLDPSDLHIVCGSTLVSSGLDR